MDGAKPTTFAGEAQKYMEWEATVLAYLRISVGERSDGWIRWPQAQQEDVTGDYVALEFGEDAPMVQDFIYVVMPSHTMDRINESRGLEALRGLTKRGHHLLRNNKDD